MPAGGAGSASSSTAAVAICSNAVEVKAGASVTSIAQGVRVVPVVFSATTMGVKLPAAAVSYTHLTLPTIYSV